MACLSMLLPGSDCAILTVCRLVRAEVLFVVINVIESRGVGSGQNFGWGILLMTAILIECRAARARDILGPIIHRLQRWATALWVRPRAILPRPRAFVRGKITPFRTLNAVRKSRLGNRRIFIKTLLLGLR